MDDHHICGSWTKEHVMAQQPNGDVRDSEGFQMSEKEFEKFFSTHSIGQAYLQANCPSISPKEGRHHISDHATFDISDHEDR